MMDINTGSCDSICTITTRSSNEDVESPITWKEKYHIANKQLDRFRQKASKIREVLATKVHLLLYVDIVILI